MNIATRGMKNAFRNTTRTLSITIILGLSIGLSLVMLIAHQTVQDQIRTTLSSIGNTVSILPAGGFNSLVSESNLLTTDKLQRVRSITHVTNVDEQLNDRVQTVSTAGSNQQPNEATTSLRSPYHLSCSSGVCSGGDIRARTPNGGTLGNLDLDMAVIGTNTPTDPSNIDSSWLTIISGHAIDNSADTDNAMVSKAMAQKNNLSVGSTFEAYAKILTVAAIFNCDTQGGSNSIIVSLPTLQRLTGYTNDITTATATVDSLENLSTATSAIKTLLGSSADVKSDVDQANAALQPLDSVKRVSLYSLIGAVMAGAVIILLTMIMIVRERKREIGIFKAIGFGNIRIMVQFMAEALTLTVLGAVIGLIIGVLGGNPVTTTLVSNSTNSSNSVGAGKGSAHLPGAPSLSNIQNVHAQIGWSIILYGLGAAVVTALVGSALASYFISKVRPAEVLRSE